MHRPKGSPAVLTAATLAALGIAPAAFAAPQRGAANLAPLTLALTLQDAGTLVNEARALMGMGKFAEAVPKFSEAIKQRPDYVAAYQDRGTCYFNLNKFPEALKDFGEVIKLKPAVPQGYFNRGIVLLNVPTPDYKTAAADFSKVIELNPKPTPKQNLVLESYDKRAYCNLLLQQWQAAIADCTQVLQADPKRANAYLNRALAYTSITPPDAPKAIADYGAALANSTTPDEKLTVYFSRAELYLKNNQIDEAIADLSEGLKLKPDNAEAYAARAAAQFQKGRFAEAVADYTKVAQLKTADSGVYRDRAAAYMQLKDYPKAIADYSEFLKRVPNPPAKDVFKFRAAAYMNVAPPNYTAAIADYQAYLAANGTDAVAWHDLAAASFLSADSKPGPALDQAIAAAEKSLALKADQADMNLVKADGHALRGQFDTSIPFYTRYIELKKDDPVGYEGRGRAYFNLKKLTEALADFEAFLAKAPAGDKTRGEIEKLRVLALEGSGGAKSPDQLIEQYTKLINANPNDKDSALLYTNRGVAYFNKGEFDTALKDFEQAAKLDGGQPESLVNIASAAFRKAEKTKAPADYAAAGAAYTKVLEKAPTNADALASRADINLAQKKYAEAIADYTKFLTANPNAKETVAVLTNRAAAYLLLPTPDFKGAVADYTAILTKQPNDPAIYNLRALAYKSQKEWASAIADFTKQLDLTKPKADPAVLLARAECSFNLGMARRETPTKGVAEFDAAIADYTTFLAGKPDAADVLYSRGLAYYRKSGRKTLPDLDKAIADFEAATKAKADLADAWYRLGLACDDYGVASEPDQEKMFTKAIEAYGKFLALPGVPQADIDMTKKRIADLKEALGL